MVISTKERVGDYSLLYKNLFNITGKPESIIDLGSGFNSLSFPLMHLNKLDYLALDIDEKDILLLNKYFKIMNSQGLKGRAEILDTTNLEKIAELPKVNLIFLFKIIDLIDKKNKILSERLIKILKTKCNFIIASFATKTLTRKPMNLPRRRGFELMLERNNLSFDIIETDNEIFYIIKSS